MKGYVDADVVSRHLDSISTGDSPSKEDKNAVADGLKKWAMERGATQFAHWFSPIRGANGLKKDTFIDLDWGAGGTVLPAVPGAFSGSLLYQSETDGSSFPNGGLRATHTAAAYMSWDRLSPPFVRGDTVYIPSSFITWTGAAEDEKTPLLRSQEAVNKEGVRLMKAIGTECNEVVCNVGWEQEFFCIDVENYLQRPDLMAAGRTLIGAQPPRGQQTDYNYFNVTQPRVANFLEEVQAELWAIACPLSVTHNEVAPSQYEFSPIFSLTNISNDTNTASMEILSEVATRHGLAVLCHEKPFAGINGSGKHNNWGLNTDTGDNLYAPGKTAEAQARFMTMVAVLAQAVNRHGDLIRCSVASAGNDHRLGAQEAPPAIISLYTGVAMEAHIKSIIGGGDLEGYGNETKMVAAGARAVPDIEAGTEDRNRTAPFPFCGNRFEFRAVGSQQNIAFPLAVLHSAVAESLGEMADCIEGGMSQKEATAKLFAENERIIFNGNGYDEAWHHEAEHDRGLPNLRNTVDAFEIFANDKAKDLFSKANVYTPAEVDARQEISLEAYTNTITLESSCMIEMIETGILPACAADLNAYGNSGLEGDRPTLYKDVAAKTKDLADALDALPTEGDAVVHAQARYCADVVKPAMEALRLAADEAELVIAADKYPYPKYREMLYDHHFEDIKAEF
jgi:glutamine synthetase